MNQDVTLLAVQEKDLAIFFQQQLDPQANQMAAFTAEDPADEAAFTTRWQQIRADEAITLRTILDRDQVAGHILGHGWFGKLEVSSWLGRPFWGKGIASAVLAQFLDVVQERPLFARAAKDNLASMRLATLTASPQTSY